MKKIAYQLAFILLLATVSLSLHAASPGINNADLFDSILARFANTASAWSDKMVDYGSWLFWGLALISMTWTFGMMALKKADIQEFFAETIRFFVVTGFFFWILKNGPAIAIAIIDTMRQIASSASGLSKVVSPSGIVDIGFDILCKVVDKSSFWSPASTIVGLLVAGIILVVLAFVGVNMLLILIDGWLLAYCGVFLLGFGGGRWTQDIAINYYKTVLGVAIQAFTMILIVGIGKSFIDQYYTAMGEDMALKELFVMLVVAIILYTLIKTLPPKFAGIVGGGGAGGDSGGVGLGSALAGGAMLAAGASSLASAALGAGSSMAGGASAIKAAFQAAQQSMSAGSSGSSGSSGGGGSSGGLAAAMGNAGRMATEMGSHLAKGVAQAVGDKMGAMKDAMEERIADTMGGKIAAAIQNNAAESSDDDSAQQNASNDSSLQESFSDSLSAGNKAQSGNDSINDEVANFVNKPSVTEGA